MHEMHGAQISHGSQSAVTSKPKGVYLSLLDVILNINESAVRRCVQAAHQMLIRRVDSDALSVLTAWALIFSFILIKEIWIFGLIIICLEPWKIKLVWIIRHNRSLFWSSIIILRLITSYHLKELAGGTLCVLELLRDQGVFPDHHQCGYATSLLRHWFLLRRSPIVKYVSAEDSRRTSMQGSRCCWPRNPLSFFLRDGFRFLQRWDLAASRSSRLVVVEIIWWAIRATWRFLLLPSFPLGPVVREVQLLH